MSREEEKKVDGDSEVADESEFADANGGFVNIEAVIGPLGSGILPRRLLVTRGMTLNEIVKAARNAPGARDEE